MKETVIENVRDFDVKQIFDCGQCFRWEPEDDGTYTGIAMGKVVNIGFVPYSVSEDNCTGKIIIKNATGQDVEEIWRKYLDLERDYGKIKETLAASDPLIGKAIECGKGIRILNQDKWETLISFIISQNNNIPRIKGCIETLSRNFGTLAGTYNGREYYNLPSPEVLAELTEEDLSICRLGYRSDYLLCAAAKVVAEGREKLNSMNASQLPSEEVYDYLLGFKGVGPKVANCIMLFSMNCIDSFPVDVWMRRVMNRLYDIDEVKTAQMKAFAEEHFAPYGGIAQQYLFYYIRLLDER